MTSDGEKVLIGTLCDKITEEVMAIYSVPGSLTSYQDGFIDGIRRAKWIIENSG